MAVIMHILSTGILPGWTAARSAGQQQTLRSPSWLSCTSCSNVKSCPFTIATTGLPTEYKLYHTHVYP